MVHILIQCKNENFALFCADFGPELNEQVVVVVALKSDFENFVKKKIKINKINK